MVDFQRHSFACGKNISECYSLVVSYPVDNRSYTLNSNRKFKNNRPTHLLQAKYTVYYSQLDPRDAILGGPYSHLNHYIWMFSLSCIVLLVFWIVGKRKYGR